MPTVLLFRPAAIRARRAPAPSVKDTLNGLVNDLSVIAIEEPPMLSLIARFARRVVLRVSSRTQRTQRTR